MLTRRSLAATMAAFMFFPVNAQAREKGELLRRIAQKRQGGKPPDASRTQLGKGVTTVSYGPAKLDIHAPAGARGLPVVMFIHGGGWKNGNRKYVQTKPEFFTGKGYVFVSIDYRMLPEAEVTVQAKDVEAAFAFVRANISKYGGDTNRIAVMGHSAGCHLAALTGMRGGLPGVAALVLNDVENYDLVAFMQAGTKPRIYGEAFPDPAQWDALSPTSYVNSGRHPPTMIAYSKTRGHEAAAKKFAASLKAAGTKVTLYDGSAYSHFAINRGFGAESGGMTGATMAFLKSVLG